METRKPADGDAFIAAIYGETPAPSITLYEQEWVMAPEIPVIVRLRLAKAMSPDEELTADEEAGMLSALFGRKQYNELLEAGLTPSAVTAILVTALSAYSGGDAGDSLAKITAAITAKTEDGETSDDADPKAN